MAEYINEILNSYNLNLEHTINIILSQPHSCPCCGGMQSLGTCEYCGNKNELLENSILKLNCPLKTLLDIFENLNITDIGINHLFNNLLKLDKYNIDIVKKLIDKFNYKGKILDTLKKDKVTDIEKEYLNCLVDLNDSKLNVSLFDVFTISAVSGKKCVDYDTFKKLFTNHVEDVLGENIGKSHCIVEENLMAYGREVNGLAYGNDIAINDKNLKDLYDGKSIQFIETLFHEMRHTVQHKIYRDGLTNDYVLNMIKDEILSKNEKYYMDNYDRVLLELDAEYNGMESTINYFKHYKIDLEVFRYYEEKMKEIKEKMSDKTRIVDGTLRNLDDIFNEYIKDKVDLLNEYKQLNYIYKVDNGMVVEKSFDEMISDYNNLIKSSNNDENIRLLYKELLSKKIDCDTNIKHI